MTDTVERIPAGLWSSGIAGRNLSGGTLGGEIGGGSRLLVFLRHFG